MPYIALYRKYRARGFDEVLGQKHVTQTLQNAVRSGKFAHAYLFCGPRGSGKTSTARLLAKALNCLNGPTAEPCDDCEMCVRVREGSAMDVVEMDAASETGIDNVKETIIENAKYPPMDARYKIYIIDEVHDLSSKAFDALLKTLEEPPAHVVFILATTEFQKVPATIRSRCQLFQFHRGSIADLLERLNFVAGSESAEVEPAAMAAIARMADGSWRDALTLLEQVMAYGSDGITIETVNNALGLVEEDVLNRMVESMATGDAAGALEAIEKEMKRGREARSIFEALIGKLRELVYVSHNVEGGEWLDPHRRSVLHEQAVRIGRTRLQRWWGRLAEAAGQLRNVGSPRLWLELAVLDLVTELEPPAHLPTTDEETVTEKPVVRASKEPIAEAPLPPPPSAARFASPSPRRQAADEPVVDPTPSQVAHETPATDEPEDEQARFDHIWQQTLERIRGKYPTATPLLSGAKITGMQDHVAVIAFPTELGYTRMQKKERVKAVEQELSATLNEPGWRITVELMPQLELGMDDAEADEEIAVQLPAEGEALANMVADVFDGDKLDSNKKG